MNVVKPPDSSPSVRGQFTQEAGVKTLGVLVGEGIGAEVINAALGVLRAVERTGMARFEVRMGQALPNNTMPTCGEVIPRKVVEFCEEIFGRSGPILCGPHGGRFVYELRKKFDLFCKFSPLMTHRALANATRMKPESVGDVDILFVRDNSAGVYQGEWDESPGGSDGPTARHTFSYSAAQIIRVLNIAAAAAKKRRGMMTVVVKPGGVPTISRLWIDHARQIAQSHQIRLAELEIDNAVYQLVQHPRQFDVIVSPNLFGDILSDVGAVLLGSRGLSFGGSISSNGAAVYQTNHGAAHDLAGTDRANPVGQIFSLAMLCRESLDLAGVADLIESAVAQVWNEGYRTEDLNEAGCAIIGTREMGERIATAAEDLGARSTPAVIAR